MAIADAAALGAAIEKNPGNLRAALGAYEAERVPTTTQEVLALHAMSSLLHETAPLAASFTPPLGCLRESAL